MGRYFWNAGATLTLLFYDGSAHVEERSGSNALLRRYIHGPGTDTPLVWYEGPGTTDKRWLIADERGSIIAITNASGAVTNVNRYDDYGVPASTNVGRFQYTGQAWVPELSLYYYKARIYAPSLGRFMQTDPTGYDDGPNWYDYVGGDPVNKSDPTGLQIAGTFSAETACGGSSACMEGYRQGQQEVASVLVDVLTVIAVAVDVFDGPTPDVGAAAVTARASRAGVAGGRFSQATKAEIYAANRARNGGVLRSDKSGQPLVPSQKSQKGVPTPRNAAQVDHHVPRSKGGTNDASNGRVLSAPENRAKSDTTRQSAPPSPRPRPWEKIEY